MAAWQLLKPCGRWCSFVAMGYRSWAIPGEIPDHKIPSADNPSSSGPAPMGVHGAVAPAVQPREYARNESLTGPPAEAREMPLRFR